MQYRDLCGNRVSNLGMGNMRLPTQADGTVDREQAAEIIRYVYGQGVNYFDTAFPYHNGESEVALGEALSIYPRKSYYLADKFWYQSQTPGMSIRDFFEIQLKRCGTDYFDYYLIHNVSDLTIGDYLRLDREQKMLDYLESEKDAGRIKHLGFSCHAGPENLRRFLDYHQFDFVQIQCNYLDWKLQRAQQKYELLAARKIPVVVMESCRGGRLADLGPQNNAKLKALRPDESVVSWAFRYLQGLPNVRVILSGFSKLAQAQDTVGTFSMGQPLTPSERTTLEQIAATMVDIIPCTACHYCRACPQHLDIPGLIAMYNDARFDMTLPAFQLAGMPAAQRPESCIGCGQCRKACPQGIDIPAIMKDFDRRYKAVRTTQ